MTEEEFTETAFATLTGRGSAMARPASTGVKFAADGAVIPFPGNTFLCHIPRPSAAFDALRAAQAALRAEAPAGAFAWLPPDSFHMTVFEGVTEAGRNSQNWPQDQGPDATLAQVTAEFAARTRGLRLGGFRIRPHGIFGGYSITVGGTDPQAEADLRAARAMLRDATTIRRVDFDSYRFHITLGYPLRWLTEGEAHAMLGLAADTGARLMAQVPAILLGPVELCTFADMHRFDPVALLV